MHDKKKLFGKYRYDIAVEDGVGATLVTWVTGLMVFFVTLTLSIHFGLATMMQGWVTGLSGSLTVEISAQEAGGGAGKSADDIAANVLALVREHPDVAESRLMSRDEVRALIQPWLGEKLSGDLPLPALIDLKLTEGADAARLQGDILTVAPSAVIDSHTDTLDDVRALVGAVRLFALLLTSIIVALAVVAIAGIVRSKFSIHRQEVETLHLIGASDEYIARQFRHHALHGTLKGALLGIGATAGVLAAGGYVTRAVESAVLPHLQLAPAQWALLFLAPVAAGVLIAHITAQIAVMKELGKLP